jgi:hypothetical protein
LYNDENGRRFLRPFAAWTSMVLLKRLMGIPREVSCHALAIGST